MQVGKEQQSMHPEENGAGADRFRLVRNFALQNRFQRRRSSPFLSENALTMLTPKVVLRSKILNEPFRKAEFAGGTRRFRKLRMTKEQWTVISSQWVEKTEY